jgi:hypothetical protein
VQRGQCHPAFRSGQFSYPLSFRGQVCKAQRPLPCFPPTALSSRRPPSLDRVPVSPVPRRHQHYEGATTSHPRIPGHLFGSLPGPTRFLLVRARRCQRSQGGGGLASGQDHCSAGDPLYRHALAWTRVGPLRFPDDPSCAFASFQDPGRTDNPSPWRSRRCCPRSHDSEGFSVRSISGLPRGFSTCCLRFKNDVATIPARLASGWLARLCREGVKPTGSQ